MTVGDLRKALEMIDRDDMTVMIISDNPFGIVPDDVMVTRRCEVYGGENNPSAEMVVLIS